MKNDKRIELKLWIALTIGLILSMIAVSTFGQNINPTFRSVKVDSIRARQDTIWLSDQQGGIAYILTKNDSLVFGDASGEKYLALLATGGNPGGSPGDIQYNNAGNFDGAPMTTDGTDVTATGNLSSPSSTFGSGADTIRIDTGIVIQSPYGGLYGYPRFNKYEIINTWQSPNYPYDLSAFQKTPYNFLVQIQKDRYSSYIGVVPMQVSISLNKPEELGGYGNSNYSFSYDKGFLFEKSNGSDTIFRVDTLGRFIYNDNTYQKTGFTWYPTSGIWSPLYDNDSSRMVWASAPASETVDITYNSVTAGSNDDTVRIDKNGIHLYGDATQWTDIAITGFHVTTAANAPTFTTGFSGNADLGAWYYQGSVQDDIAYFNIQVPHGVVDNDTISFHFHWAPTTNPGAVSAVFLFTYQYADINGTFSTPATATITIPLTGLVQWRHYLTSLYLSPTGTGSLSRIWNCSLKRLANSDANDTYTSDIALISIDAHGRVNSFGSNKMTSE